MRATDPRVSGVRAGTIAATTATPAATSPTSTSTSTTLRSIAAAAAAISGVRDMDVGSLGGCLRGDLRRHLAGDAELIRLPPLLGDDRDHLLEPLLERVEVLALLALQHLGDARRGLELDLVVVDEHARATNLAQ